MFPVLNEIMVMIATRLILNYNEYNEEHNNSATQSNNPVFPVHQFWRERQPVHQISHVPSQTIQSSAPVRSVHIAPFRVSQGKRIQTRKDWVTYLTDNSIGYAAE